MPLAAMGKLSLWSVIVMVLLDSGVVAYPNGAPNSACTGMIPGHGGRQSSPSPYSITVSSSSYKPDVPITVSVTTGYQGILLQARKTDGSTVPVGTFTSSPANTRIVTCSRQGDAVTHSSTTPKTATDFIWMPPSDSVGPVKFVATIAKGKYEYWVKVESSEVQVLVATSPPPSSSTKRTTAQTSSSSSSISPSIANSPSVASSPSVSILLNTTASFPFSSSFSVTGEPNPSSSTTIHVYAMVSMLKASLAILFNMR